MTIPYHDPALPFRARHEALRDQYDFICDCKLCEWSERHLGSEEKIPAPPGNSAALKSLGRAVQVFGLPLSSSEGPPGFTYNITNQPLFQNLPESLLVAMHPMYLPALSEAFSLASHGGPLVDAVEVGKTLLALYRIIYPPAFPLVGVYTPFSAAPETAS